MSESTQPYNEIDDYIATFSEEERQEYVAAEMALDLASTLYRLRQALSNFLMLGLYYLWRDGRLPPRKRCGKDTILFHLVPGNSSWNLQEIK